MATRKVTVTLPEEQLEAIQRLIGDGRAASVSGFVQRAVAVTLDEVSEWRVMLDAALRETGGPLTDAEAQWADEVLGLGKSPGAAGPA